MWLITGLGNPGTKYYKTWHNLGFLAIDLLAEKHGITIGKSKFDGEYGKGRIEGEDVILLKPFTYMNNSGISVAAAAVASAVAFVIYKLVKKYTEDLVCDCDDLLDECCDCELELDEACDCEAEAAADAE